MPPGPPFTSTLLPLLPTPNQQPLTTKNPIKRMSPAEQQRRREQGICFWCDDNIHLTTNAPIDTLCFINLKLRMIVISYNQKPLNNNSRTMVKYINSINRCWHITCLLMQCMAPSTIHVRSQINGMHIHALIDGGSSDSLPQPRIAKFLSLTRNQLRGFV